MELTIRNLSKTYANGVCALNGLSLTIPNGMFGLLGPNGAGKSSLMRTIATLQEPDAGSITLGNIDVLTDKDAVRRVLGYLPQEFGLYPSISAEVLLDHFASLKGIRDGRERKLAVEALLQQTNLWAARKKNLGGYSGGMRQRFGIAVALLGSPQLIIVDEPTVGLDPTERNRFLDLLSEIGENVVVILSTHIVEDVTELCSNMAIIAGGEVVATGQPADVIANCAARSTAPKPRKPPWLNSKPSTKSFRRSW
jgi:ABC-2 type transport system ATP-binding protein